MLMICSSPLVVMIIRKQVLVTLDLVKILLSHDEGIGGMK